MTKTEPPTGGMQLRLLWVRKGAASRASALLYAKIVDPPPEDTPAASVDAVRAGGYFKRADSRRKSLINRLLAYGESKWHGLAAYPTGSLRGRLYRLGTGLIDQIPMQERMLWRVHTFLVAREEERRAPLLPPIEVAPTDLEGRSPPSDSPSAGLTMGLAAEILAMLEAQARLHRRWRLLHGLAIVPALCLSLLPFVKLWLAWEVFRTLTHHRALRASNWLRDALGRATTSYGKRRASRLLEEGHIQGPPVSAAFLPNAGLEAMATTEEALAQVDPELPSVMRQL